MGRRGPKPTPTETLKSRGSWRAKVREATEPRPPGGKPKCPDWLDEVAKKKWKELAPKLTKMGLLTSVDGDALASYCVAWSQLVKADETIRAEGMTFKTSTGYLSVHPMVAVRKSAMDDIRRFGSLFGLNPADRGRLHSVENGAKGNEGGQEAKLYAEFFGATA